MYPTTGGLAFSCRFNEALFRPETIELRVLQWCHLLAELAECPEQPVGSVSLYSRQNHALVAAFQRAETARIAAHLEAVRDTTRR